MEKAVIAGRPTSNEVLERIAFYQDRRDEVPNQELARQLAQASDADGIREIAENLWHKNESVRSDCLKVLYEVGYLKPELIAGHVGDFLKLLTDKKNRMVWGAMIALGTIASLRPKEIFSSIDTVLKTVDSGSVITTVWGVKVLAKVAASDDKRAKVIWPKLLGYLKSCIPRDVPTHLTSITPTITKEKWAEVRAIIEGRKGEMSKSHLTRLGRAVRGIEVQIGQ